MTGYLLRINFNRVPISFEGSTDKNFFVFRRKKDALYNPFNRLGGDAEEISVKDYELYNNSDLKNWMLSHNYKRDAKLIGFNFFFKKIEDLQKANIIYLFEIEKFKVVK